MRTIFHTAQDHPLPTPTFPGQTQLFLTIPLFEFFTDDGRRSPPIGLPHWLIVIYFTRCTFSAPIHGKNKIRRRKRTLCLQEIDPSGSISIRPSVAKPGMNGKWGLLVAAAPFLTFSLKEPSSYCGFFTRPHCERVIHLVKNIPPRCHHRRLPSGVKTSPR